MEGVSSATPAGGTDPLRLLTVIVPAYNSEDYLERCLECLTGFDTLLEVIIVDDGSTDSTGALADARVSAEPGVFRVIHQANAGHGGAVNAGVAAARGLYVKVLDSDDWLDRASLMALLTRLRLDHEQGHDADLLIVNYVYEKQGKRHKHVVRFHNVCPRGRIFGWDEIQRCHQDQYLMMHALVLRTETVRASGVVLPEHTFYVDYLFSYIPLLEVRTIRYLDIDLYRYFIGRDDQSVNEKVMISRIDQLIRVNRGMIEATPARADVPEGLYRYLVHYLTINCIVTSVMMLVSGTPENLAAKDRLWRDFEQINPEAYAIVRKGLLGRLISLPGTAGRVIPLEIYRVARSTLGLN